MVKEVQDFKSGRHVKFTAEEGDNIQLFINGELASFNDVTMDLTVQPGDEAYVNLGVWIFTKPT